ncbi:hypothetical protein GGX14DRAFT_534701 [Mycena pura]|uniref:Uncharacterized protein n=1 Tax=Mycena pura TaxID=153505 RepID=A0AAD6YB88_9AGAR|nr:hypothetical protein GGX14DRAFT_534701 [Mycena pura]
MPVGQLHLCPLHLELTLPALTGLENYVNTPEFDITCSQKQRELFLSSDNGDFSDFSDFSDDDGLYTRSESISTTAPDENQSRKISKFESYFYYCGLNMKGRWPNLLMRDSSDIFLEPTGPHALVRPMRLTSVPEDHDFAKRGLWEKVRDRVAMFLVRNDVRVSSVDFVRFHWVNKMEDREIDSEEEDAVEAEEDEKKEEGAADDDDLETAYASMALIKPVKEGDDYYTNPTVWIGILPETLTSDRAFKLMGEIRTFLDSLAVKNVDIAFRESLAHSLVASGPELYAPVESGDPLKDFIDNVSVALSLPISGRKTAMQGTMGPYFHRDGKLYAITARHNLFLANDGNPLYKYDGSAPKREVVVMGNPAFTNYQNSIQARIGTLNDAVESLELQIDSLRKRVATGIGLPGTRNRLEESEAEEIKIRRQIVSLKQFFRYTRDICVIELDKSKFRHFIGNVLSLGPEYSPSYLTSLVLERLDAPSNFKYPQYGLLNLRGMLEGEQGTVKLQRDAIRRVLKRGFTTKTTVGTLGNFQSFVCKYFLISGGTLESIELPILSHENDTGTFSKGGDSGALIVSPKGEFVGLLTGGASKGTDGSDITYATPFDWVWKLVLEEFPGANLYWDDIAAFLAA